MREALGVGHGGDSTTAPAKLAYLQPVLQNVASQRIVGRREAHDANLKRGEPAEKPPLPQVRGDAEHKRRPSAGGPYTGVAHAAPQTGSTLGGRTSVLNSSVATEN